MRRTTTTFLCLLALTAFGCSEGNNVQNSPIGSRCSSSGDCGTKPYNCDTTAPGGYCQKDCVTDGDCPGDSICPAHECRRKCSSNTQCRDTEGYACISDGTNLFCDVASGNADGGG